MKQESRKTSHIGKGDPGFLEGKTRNFCLFRHYFNTPGVVTLTSWLKQGPILQRDNNTQSGNYHKPGYHQAEGKPSGRW